MGYKINDRKSDVQMVNGELIKKLNQVSSYLSNNGRLSEGNELEDYAKRIQEADITKQELDEIKMSILSRCDVRWLGDVHIKEIQNPYEWWNLLGSIKSLAEKI
jgi:hypothetical protein